MNVIKKLFMITVSILMVFTLSFPFLTNAMVTNSLTDSEKKDIVTHDLPEIEKKDLMNDNSADSEKKDSEPAPSRPIHRDILLVSEDEDYLAFSIFPFAHIKSCKISTRCDYEIGRPQSEQFCDLPSDYYYLDKDYNGNYYLIYTDKYKEWLKQKKDINDEKKGKIEFIHIFLELLDDKDNQIAREKFGYFRLI